MGGKYPGLVRAFGAERAAAIAGNVIRLAYDGTTLPPMLQSLNPRFLLEAVPENLAIKSLAVLPLREESFLLG